MSRNRLALIVVISLALLLPGCMGRMALTGKVGKWNLEITENRFGRAGMFIGLHIIPVYPITAFVDLLVINSIEFWTHENPLNGQPALVETQLEPDGDDGDDDDNDNDKSGD